VLEINRRIKIMKNTGSLILVAVLFTLAAVCFAMASNVALVMNGGM